jgi:hypothetical protein
VVLAAAVIDRRYRWVVALERSIAVEVDELPVVPRKVVDLLGVRGSEEVGVRSAAVEAKSLPRLLLHRQ